MAPPLLDSKMEIEVYDNDTEVGQVILQGDQQLSDSILVLSTIHPPTLLGTPRFSHSLAIEEQPATGMEDEVTSYLLAWEPSAPGMDGEQTTSTPNLTTV